MKKYDKYSLIVFSISMTLFLATLIACVLVDEQIKPYLLIPALFFAAVYPIYMCFSETIITAVSGWRNLNNCTLECFNTINKIVKGRKSSNIDFQQAIMYINHSYTDGEVKSLINQKDIYNLYERKDMLLKQSSFYDDTTQILSSLFISVMASLLVMSIEPFNDIVRFTVLIGFFLMLVYVVFFKYSKRGQEGSYIHFLFKYELELLDVAIHSVEENLKVEPVNFLFIETRHNVLNELFRKAKKAKRKMKLQIENDIAIVKHLRLEVDKHSNCEIKEYEMLLSRKNSKYVTGTISIAYVVNENGCEDFASDDFRTLYKIVAKNNLCIDMENDSIF